MTISYKESIKNKQLSCFGSVEYLNTEKYAVEPLNEPKTSHVLGYDEFVKQKKAEGLIDTEISILWDIVCKRRNKQW